MGRRRRGGGAGGPGEAVRAGCLVASRGRRGLRALPGARRGGARLPAGRPLMPLLYDSPVSGNCYKVRLLLAHLGIPVERRTVDVVDRSNRPELLGDLNPALSVPTVVLDDGRPLGESGAILWFFGDRTRFVPTDPYERAQVLQWMFFEQNQHEPTIAVVRFWLAYSGRPAEDFAGQLEARTAGGDPGLPPKGRHPDGRAVLPGGGPPPAA